MTKITYLIGQLKIFKDLSDVAKSDINYLRQEIKKIKQQLKEIKLPLSVPEYGICMGDLHVGNAHFMRDDQPNLFDFDQCGYDWRAFDVAKFLHSAVRKR